MTASDWNLLGLYVAGEADQQQKKQVLQWSNASPENHVVFEDACHIFKNDTIPMPVFDSKSAFQKLSATLKKNHE